MTLRMTLTTVCSFCQKDLALSSHLTFGIAVFYRTESSSSTKSNYEESDTIVDDDDDDAEDPASKPIDPGVELQQDSPLESPSPLRVRFRPRVRIASGLNRHRRRRSAMESDQDYFTLTSTSSLSGSASSSISAPLRTPLDEEVGKPGWGTLGQRVALFAKRQSPGTTTSKQCTEDGGLMAKGDVSTIGIGTERTPLLRPESLHFLLTRDSSLRHRHYHGGIGQEEDASRLVDRIFGPWPTRLLNHHVSTFLLI